MNKKLISTLLAISTLFGASSIAKASTGPEDLTATGDVTPAIINVEMPTELDFSIDPFNIGKNGKVSTAALTIENKSNVPVEIKMSKLQGTKAGELNLVDSPEALVNEEDSKDAFLWLGQVTPTFDKTDKELITSVKPTATYSEAKHKSQVITDTESSEVVSMGTLLEATYDEGSYSATHTTRGKLYLGIIGDVKTVDGWNTEDGIEVTATFDFQPLVVGSVK